MATIHSISLLSILWVILLAAKLFVPPNGCAAQLLTEVPAPPPDTYDRAPPPLPGDGRSKIGASPSTPRRDGSWSGGSSPQGTLLVPPPSSVTKIGFESRNVTSSETSSTVVSSNGTVSTTVTSNATDTDNDGASPP